MLVLLKYQRCCRIVRAAGLEELGERVHLYRFRHASATYFARFLTAYQMCSRYGWTMGSKVVQRYIDHAGVMAEDAALAVRQSLRSRPPKGTGAYRGAEHLIGEISRAPSVGVESSADRVPTAAPFQFLD